MLKIAVTAVAILAAGVSSIVLAQETKPPAQQAAAVSPPAAWSPADNSAFYEARIAALKAGLALKADQQPAWNDFEHGLRNFYKQQQERIQEARKAPPVADPIGYMRRRADAMVAAAGALKELADIAEPLYRKLDDNQKRRMSVLVASNR